MCVVLSILLLIYLDKRHHRILALSTTTDKLTGLLNRTGFRTEAERQLRLDPEGNYVIVAFDINNFKHINNSYSYATGDQLLKVLASTMTQWNKGDCISARLDADDFILLTKSSPTIISDLEATLQDAVTSLGLPEYLSNTEFTIGAYEVKNKHELIRTIIDNAYTAHKMAKLHNSTSVLWYNRTLIEKIEREAYFVAHLPQALEQKEFKLYLQPQVNLHTKSLMGAEALVRWVLPNGELVFPDAFIPIFESTGNITLLDFYMLNEACTYLSEQRDQGIPLLPISVNFSRVTLCQPNFSGRVIELVDRYDLPHHYIDIEVVESALNEMGDGIIQMLTALQHAGFRISMDDFGAGYSSLSVLGDLPVQIVKLDRQFLWGIDSNQKRKTIIHAFVDMAHHLDLMVICEGVETASHVAFLQQIGCACTQGYYFSRPVPQGDFDQVAGICMEKLSNLTANV